MNNRVKKLLCDCDVSMELSDSSIDIGVPGDVIL
jgi:hypothetical protein